MRVRWSRLLTAVAALAAVALASGCVVFQSPPTASQLQTIGDVQVTFTACASKATTCPSNGNTTPAVSAPAQALVGFQVPVSVTLPASFTTTGVEALVFADSPSYASELQRLDPAPAGRRWVGYITPTPFDYVETSGPQTFSVQLPAKLGQAPNGSPFTGPLAQDLRLGARSSNASFPVTRPVACGPSLTTLNDEDASDQNAFTICVDSAATVSTLTRDLGVLGPGATASGAGGGLASIPFTLRFAGTATATADFTLTATSTLPNASLAVTPGTIAPASNSDSQAVVAVGIPAGARAGTYDVVLSARLANGQTRTRTGKLTVTAGGGAGGGGPAARLKLTTVLPRGLSAAVARTKGIAVLIGASKAGFARVKLFQGSGKAGRKPKASKRVRLRVPGPVRVVLRSTKLKVGPYRVVITADGRTFVRRATLKK